MLAVPRPTTRAECSQHVRPCPWAACRHHLLVEATAPQAAHRTHPTSLRLNAPGPITRLGRRRALPSSAASALVRTWIDNAVEELSRMEYTCSLDVARDYPQGVPEWFVARLLGVTTDAISKELKGIARRWREQNDEA